jgi:NAD-dependent dihydropyrimidine dehydrogenase PreA subunit
MDAFNLDKVKMVLYRETILNNVHLSIARVVFKNAVVQLIYFLTEVRTMWEVVIDKDKCTGDEECVAACPAQVFEMVDGKAEAVEADECLGCETCVEVCPEEAITVTEV